MSEDKARPVVILIAEDNLADVVFFQEALEVTQIPATVHVVGDGRDAMRFLMRQGRFDDAPRPDRVVLDLNLPIKRGDEVLAAMSADPELNTIPVTILTTSTSEACVCEMYPPGRCQYFSKTADFKELQDIVRRIVGPTRMRAGT